MADIAPLSPLRFAPESLPLVVAPPYDVIDAELRARLAERHPNNVVHVDLPAGVGEGRYERARDLFRQWQERGVLVREATPAYYRYSQTFDPPAGGERRTRHGFFALVRAVPYSARDVLPHERTLSGPKLDRIALSRATRATLSPQFMLYSDPSRALDAALETGSPLADFSTDDGISHRLSRVDDLAARRLITETIARGPLLIADGHHRYETAVALAEEFDTEARKRGLAPAPRGEHLYTMALLSNGDDPNLVVFATHRLVHSVAGFDFDAFLSRAKELCEIEALPGEPGACAEALSKRSDPTALVAVAGGRAVLLTLRKDLDLGHHPVLRGRAAVVRNTAVAVLHDGLLEGVLGITKSAQAEKTNLRYLQDPTRGFAAVARGEGQAFFMMNPTLVSTIRNVAAAGEFMPQKSTFFYPKVPSGLLFHTLNPERDVRSP